MAGSRDLDKVQHSGLWFKTWVATAVIDPASLTTNTGATSTITVTGVKLGDLVRCVSFSLDTQGISLIGYVSAADTVSVRFNNLTAGTLDLASGTVTVIVSRLNPDLAAL